jgi:hypothetical protein
MAITHTKSKAFKNDNSVLIWQGPSLLDPAVLIGAFLTYWSTNAKTGTKTENIPQVTIMRLDRNPTEVANDPDLQRANCGDCKHIGNAVLGILRTCYVLLFRGPRAIWQSWSKGNVESVDVPYASSTIQGEALRLGSWGDPASVPMAVWQRLCRGVRFTLSYTHAWSSNPALRSFCMASVDTPSEREHAKALGFRTFRTLRPGIDVPMAGEILCPASAEMGRRSKCVKCGLCNGNQSTATRMDGRKDIAIYLHDPRNEALKRAIMGHGVGVLLSPDQA